MAESNLKKYAKTMELYNNFVDLFEAAAAKYAQQLPALHKKFIAQFQEQGQLPPEVQSYDQLSFKQMKLVDAALDEHFAAINTTIPLVFETFQDLDMLVELEKKLIEFWRPITEKSQSLKRTGKISAAESAQVEQFRKKIRRQSVVVLEHINANMLKIAQNCKDAELVAAARSYIIAHDLIKALYLRSNIILVNERNNFLME